MSNNLTISLAHTALHYLLQFFIPPEINLDTVEAQQNYYRTTVRQSYHGGRTLALNVNAHFMKSFKGFNKGRAEVFRQYQATVPQEYHSAEDYLYYVDINSMYPFIATQNMPCGKVTPTALYKMVSAPEEIDEHRLYRIPFFEFDTQCEYFPTIPVLVKTAGSQQRLSYPTTYDFKDNGETYLYIWGVEII